MRTFPVLAAAAVLLLFGGLAVVQIEKNPLRMDEVDYFQSMQNVITLGVPIYYSGEVAINRDLLLPLSTRQLAGQEFKFYRYKPETGKLKETFIAMVEPDSRYIYGMWHPPLYIYLGALFMRLFPLTPDSSSWLRYFNLIFMAGVFGGMAALARELYRTKWRLIFLIALALFVTNSLAVRGSILIDYNGALGPCAAVWMAVAYLRSEQQRRLHWGLISLTAGLWFTSLGIAVSLLLGLFVYWLCWGRRQVATWYPLASLCLGTAAFLLLFLVFCRIFDLPFTQPFLHNFSRAGVTWNVEWVVKMVRDAWAYVGTYSQAIGVVAFGAALAFFVRQLLQRRHAISPAPALLPVLIITGMLTQASLAANAWGFMKYVVYLLPLLFTYIAFEVVLITGTARPVWRALAVLVALAIALANGAGMYQAVRDTGGTLYIPGQQGIVAAAQRVRAQSDAGCVIISEKDLAFLAGRKFVEWSGTRFADVTYVRNLIDSEDIRWIALGRQTLAAASEEVRAYLRAAFTEDYRAEDFVVLKRN
jgi:hypothetical protein